MRISDWSSDVCSSDLSHGATVHTDVMKTQALKQALDRWGFDAAIGGARRDEEKSRAKERIFSFRSAAHRWDPKNQRPELWNLYNTRIHKGESVRSEEHTSELQSLMRISYAVFCLKKKNQ